MRGKKIRKGVVTCEMFGVCDEPSVGYFASIAPRNGKLVRTWACKEHSDWFIGRHPGQVLLTLPDPPEPPPQLTF